MAGLRAPLALVHVEPTAGLSDATEVVGHAFFLLIGNSRQAIGLLRGLIGYLLLGFLFEMLAGSAVIFAGL